MAIAIQPGTNMALILGNTGGNVQQLPNQLVGAKQHSWTERITLAAQASGVNIPVARLPFGAAMLDFAVTASVSLGTSTIAVGDMNNNARFRAAATFTTVDVPTSVLSTASVGVPLNPCYDVNGVSNNVYEDIVITVGAAALPASGTLALTIYYQDYGV